MRRIDAAISKETLHLSGTARKLRGVVEREQWKSWSTEIGAQHVLGVKYVSFALDGVDTEPESSHH